MPRTRFPAMRKLKRFDLFVTQRAADGDPDAALPQIRKALDDLFNNRQYLYAIGCTALLLEALLNRAAEGDLAEAEAAVERLAAIPGEDRSARGHHGPCGCARCWRRLAATRPTTATFGIATARWQRRWASKGIWSGPMPWPDTLDQAGAHT